VPHASRPRHLSSVAALIVKKGLPTESADAFDASFWDVVRQEVVEKAQWIRRRVFIGATVFPWNEVEYSAGPGTKMKTLQSRFELDKEGEPAQTASGSQKERDQGLPRPFLPGGHVSCYVRPRLEFAPGSRPGVHPDRSISPIRRGKGRETSPGQLLERAGLVPTHLGFSPPTGVYGGSHSARIVQT
jgi:hypothetical protein